MGIACYTIKDVAARTGMSAHTLRYYDKIGLLTFVKRSESGIRMFTEEDFEPLYTIHCLKRSGMSLDKIREFMDLYMQGNNTIHERRLLFEEQRESIKAQIAELEDMLDVVDYKCWYFAQAEREGDIDYYLKLNDAEVPQRIKDFQSKVEDFRAKKSA